MADGCFCGRGNDYVTDASWVELHSCPFQSLTQRNESPLLPDGSALLLILDTTKPGRQPRLRVDNRKTFGRGCGKSVNKGTLFLIRFAVNPAKGSFKKRNCVMAYSNYYVTFRVADKTAGGRSYADRRQSIIDAVRQKGKGYWEETTSFFLVESDLSTSALGAAAARDLSAADDLLVVIDPTDMSASYFGAVKHADVLRSFFPKLKKLP